MNSQEGKNGYDSGRISSVLKKLNVGSSWTRAEDRMEKSSMGVLRESPRKVSQIVYSTNCILMNINLRIEGEE